jgi:uncharacterized membrane-anchored protein
MKLKLLSLVLLLQTAWILGTTFVQESGLNNVTVILLETRPVDPRDLLRGDYVTLNYKISDIPLDAFSPPRTNGLPPGTTVYVALEPRGDYYEVATASTQEIAPANGRVVLRGRTQARWSETNVRLEYGLERYYVPEGSGNTRGQMTVQVAVPSSGHAQIKAVFVDGKPFAEAIKESAP